MKKFNDQTQYLFLFDQYRKRFAKIPSAKSLTQALKASQKLEYFQRGYQITQLYSL